MAKGVRKHPYLFKAFKGRKRVDTTRTPKWWINRPDEVEEFLRRLRGVEVIEVGRSAGNRPILAATWGAREELRGRTSTNLASALAGGSAAAFYGKAQRQRQSFVFLGNAHGIEFEGTVAALNFLNVVVTGKDLRGRAWPVMMEEGRKLRIVVIPNFNIDGRARFFQHKHQINLNTESSRWICQGNLKGGKKLVWPTSKRLFPIPPKKAAPLGAYFNDNGVNLVYDNALSADPQPETRALLKFLRAEMPDCVLLSHTDNGSLVCEPDAYIPERFRMRQAQMSSVVGSRCKYKGLQKSRVSQNPQGYAGQVFYQSDLIYHACGALPLLVEFPCGWQNVPDTFDEVLDIGMTVLEEIARFGNAYRFRPQEPK